MKKGMFCSCFTHYSVFYTFYNANNMYKDNDNCG